jgi:hypothetical protein
VDRLMALGLDLKQREALEALMQRIFPGRNGAEDLDAFTVKTLEISIFEEFRDSGTKYYVNNVATYAEKHGAYEALIKGLVEHGPGDAGLRDFAKALGLDVPSWVSDQAYETARDALTKAGLEDLGTLASDPVVGPLIAGARLDLKLVADELVLLASYKELHDALHRVQVPLFKTIGKAFDALKRTPDDIAILMELSEHAITLQALAADAANAQAGFKDERKAQAEAGWTKRLSEIAAAFSDATNVQDGTKAYEAFVGLKMILRQQPSRLNGLLVGVARDIPIDKLVAVLRAVAAKVGDGPDCKRLEEAASALDAIAADVRSQVTAHEAWQQAEASFWLTEEVFQSESPSVADLNSLWPTITEQVATICALAPGPWATDLARHAEAFLKLCPIPAVPPIRREARSPIDLYLYRARTQFFLTDQALKERCQKVATHSEALNALIANV